MQHFSHEPETPSPPAVMIFDRLRLFSFYPIIKMYIKHGSVKVYYNQAKSSGLMAMRILIFFGVVLDELCQIKDFGGVDSPYGRYYELQYLVFKICYAQVKRIEEVIAVFFPKLSKYSQAILANGVHDSWRESLFGVVWLQFFAERIAKELNVPHNRIALVSRSKALMESLSSTPSCSIPQSSVQVVQQPFDNDVLLVLYRGIYWSLRYIASQLPAFGKSGRADLEIKNSLPMMAATAVWGIKGMQALKSIFDDLFWWKGSNIPSERLVYLYDRADFQPTAETVRLTDSLGIKSFVMDRQFSGSFPQLLLDNFIEKSFWASLREGFQVLKRSFRALFLDAFSRHAILISSYHLVRATQLAAYYRALNVKSMVHYQTSGLDWHSLAMELVGGCRFGVVWSSISYIGSTRTPPVYFAWGANDAKLMLDCKCLSNHVLIAGTLVDKAPQEKVREKYSFMVAQLRDRGARYVLVLFDTSYFSPDFFSFFFDWLLEDPNLGLLIKSKAVADQSDFKQAYDLNGLTEKAFKTGRVQVIDNSASPGDVAIAADFAIGIGSYSAVQLAALNGARVISVDFERIDEGPYNQPYFLLHSLGPNRCVFYDFGSVKKAILEYAKNPESNPDLGDASPVLDLFDPFRDGQAGQRIGEYIGWYLEGLDKGESRDDALSFATEKYADKWGKDKVVRGLL